MNESEIKNILDLHVKWINDEDSGSRADLSGADGIMSFGPIGNQKRIGYAWLDKDGKAIIRLGCSEENLKNTAAAIRLKYGAKSTYEAMVKLAAKIIEEQK